MATYSPSAPVRRNIDSKDHSHSHSHNSLERDDDEEQLQPMLNEKKDQAAAAAAPSPSAVLPPASPPSPPAADASSSSASSLAGQKLKILLVVFSYFVISMSMVFLNKTLLTEGSSIPAPLFVTWYQCVVTVAIVTLLGELGRRTPKGSSTPSFFAQFPVFEYNWHVARKVMPLSVIFVLMISLNNLCLQYVEVTFYQVARGLTTVFNVLFTYLVLGESTSYQAMLCCALIVAGFYVGVDNEVNFTLLGTTFGVLSSVFVTLNALYTKKIASLVDGNQWKLALYNNVNAALLFPPVILLAQEHLVLLKYWDDFLLSPAYWFVMTLTGVFGFLIGIVTVFQITLTSPLTHNIAGTAKATLQTLLALFIYQNPVTWQGGVGILLVLLGSAAYTYVRNVEMNRNRPPRQ